MQPIRYLYAAPAALLLGAPAAAQTEHRVVGANPAATYAVCAEDTLVLAKPMGRELLPDGSRAPGWPAWNDRARSNAQGNWFLLSGATRIQLVGSVPGKGWVYRPLDAAPCAAAPAPTPAPTPAPVSTKPVGPAGEFELTPEDQLLLPAPLPADSAQRAGLALAGVVGASYVHVPTRTLHVSAAPTAPAVPKPQFRNGIALSNSQNGYVEDPVRFTAPYIFTGGVRSIRMPVKRKNLFDGTALTPVITLNGYPTKQLEPIYANIKLALDNDVMFLLDDHTYSTYGTPGVLEFWVAMGTALKQRFGPSDLIVLELQNEAGGGGGDPDYAASVKRLVAGIRAAGIDYKLAIGWGKWNNAGAINDAMAALDAVGGPQAIDPLNRIIWTGHFYPTTTGNDQAKAGKSKPEISGDAVQAPLVTFFETCRARNLQCMITEMGMGGGARGWLANGSGNPAFDGKAWNLAYQQLQAQYAGNALGAIAWGGGAAWKDDYPFKIEYAKDAWGQTPGTDFFQTMKPFWSK